jgi:hypothetical protein
MATALYYIVTELDCSIWILSKMGLYYSQIFDTTPEFNYRLSKNTKQYLSVNSCPVASSLFTCFTAVSITKTVIQ